MTTLAASPSETLIVVTVRLKSEVVSTIATARRSYATLVTGSSAATQLHHSVEHGVLAMDVYQFA